MLYVVAFLVAAGLGFVASRLVRRPANVAQAASVARNVSGSLGARRGLDAPELQRACFSEMVRHVRVNRQGRTSAPAQYLLRLNPGDMAVVDESRRWFTDGLSRALRDAADQNGWALDGPVRVDFRADPSRRPGVPLAVPGGPEGADPAVAAPRTSAAPTASRTTRAAAPRAGSAGRTTAMALVRVDTGERVPLAGTAVTVGRSAENTISSADERISRAHARIEPIGGGWVVVDQGSANGTRVDGSRIRPGAPIPLTAGMVVGIGPLDLRVVAATPPASAAEPAAGTRALDEAERTRISAEVLGPPGGSRSR